MPKDDTFDDKIVKGRKLSGDRNKGYSDAKTKEQIIFPQYSHQTNAEYDEVVNAHRTGIPLSQERSDAIQRAMDRRARDEFNRAKVAMTTKILKNVQDATSK